MYDTVISFLLAGVVITGIGSCSYSCVKDIRDKEAYTKECIIEHGGKEFVTETEVMVTPSGCKIVHAVKHDKDCRVLSSMYLTTCAGQVTWECGKNCIEKNVTVQKDD